MPIIRNADTHEERALTSGAPSPISSVEQATAPSDCCLGEPEAGELIVAELERVMLRVKERALEHKDLLCIARSHGIHAEPTTFGLKLAGWYDDLRRSRTRLLAAIEEISVGMLSGAVGTYAFVDPEVEEYVCERLELQPVPVSSQVIPRDRHAAFFTALAQMASAIERFAARE